MLNASIIYYIQYFSFMRKLHVPVVCITSPKFKFLRLHTHPGQPQHQRKVKKLSNLPPFLQESPLSNVGLDEDTALTQNS